MGSVLERRRSRGGVDNRDGRGVIWWIDGLRSLEDRDGLDVAYIPVSTGSYVDVGIFAIILSMLC